MDNKDFQELALRVLANDASATESAFFQSMLAKDPARSQEFKEIKETMALLRNAAPVAGALDAKGPELPAYRMNELRDAVRAEFRDKKSATSTSPQPWLSFKWMFASGFAGAALVCMLVFTVMGHREIEVGMYEGYIMRGATQVVIPASPLVHQHSFKKDNDFDQWKQTPLAWNEKAKVWVDEETDLIHVVRHTGWNEAKETTEKLAAKESDQGEQLKRIIQSLE